MIWGPIYPVLLTRLDQALPAALPRRDLTGLPDLPTIGNAMDERSSLITTWVN